jgi:predicted nucleic acid-binding protein
MKIFLDANILVSVLNNEYPSYTYTSRILSLADSGKFVLYTSPICLAIAFYFAEKKTSAAVAKKNIGKLTERLSITTVTKNEVHATLKNKRIDDFEDGLQYYSAELDNCDLIITDNVNDFHFSKKPVYDPEMFFKNILATL